MDKDKVLEFLRGLEKLKGADVKSEDYKSPLESDKMIAKGGSADVTPAVTKMHGMTQKIDTKGIAPVISGSDFTKKIEALRAAKAGGKALGKTVGKKIAGIIPLAGVGMAMMDSPAASASEMIQDPNVQRAALSELAGPAGDIIDFSADAITYGLDNAMDISDEHNMKKSEKIAKDKYEKSPARLAKLKALIGKK